MESAVDNGHGMKGVDVPDDGVGFARDLVDDGALRPDHQRDLIRRTQVS